MSANAAAECDIPAPVAASTEETAALRDGAEFWRSTPIERLDTPGIMVTDGPARRFADPAR